MNDEPKVNGSDAATPGEGASSDSIWGNAPKAAASSKAEAEVAAEAPEEVPDAAEPEAAPAAVEAEETADAAEAAADETIAAADAETDETAATAGAEAEAEAEAVEPDETAATAEPAVAATAVAPAVGTEGERPPDPDDVCPVCGGGLAATSGAAETTCAACGNRVLRHRATGKWVPADPALRSADGIRRWRREHANLVSPSLGLETCPLCLNLLRFATDEDETTCGHCGNRILRHRTTGEVLPADLKLRSQTARESWRREHTDVLAEREAIACPVCGESLKVLPYRDETVCTRCDSRLIRHRVNGEWVLAPTPAGGAAAASQSGTPGQVVGGFVCSVLGLVLIWVPFLGVVLGVVGIILSLTGRGQAKARNASTGLAIAGLAIGCVTVVLWVVFLVIGIALLEG